MPQAPEGGWTAHPDAPADDLRKCPECGLPAHECTALTMGRLSASEYLEDNAGLSRHEAKARALELIPERAKPRTADDLVNWKSREPLPSGPLADALERIETDTMVDYGLRTIHGENVLAMAAARIRSLEAQRDKAVGHVKRLTNEVAFDAFGRVSFGSFFLPLLKEARAFLDSLTEKR